MARNGIAPLSTTIALAFTSGSSTTSQRPTPKNITRAMSKPPRATTEKTRQLRKRGRETVAGLSEFAIWEPAHAIPPRRSGQSAAPGRRFRMGGAHDLCPALRRPRLRRRIVAHLEGRDGGEGGL